jgi:anti-sigma B factor antagonist
MVAIRCLASKRATRSVGVRWGAVGLAVVQPGLPCGAPRKARSMSAARVPAMHGEFATVALPDEIDLATAPDAWLDMLDALWSGASVVIADMTGTVFCDGTGANMLAAAHREAVAADIELRIAAPSPRVRYILELTRIEGMVPIYPTLSAALTGTPPGEADR